MNNSKRNTEMSTKTFCLLVAVAAALFVLGMNAVMTKMEARWAAQEQMMADLCNPVTVAKRPFVCISWDANRKASRVMPPQG
ncbi:hypothetical protein [Pseudomonas sp. NPDC089569]|uniref:hypothetical protein n=1 Tax=Pseudomonas sp. NPDC089569 TaxID=3390722 RepID=UPI003D0812DC